MYETNNSAIRTTVTVPEARDSHKDVDELHDGRRMRLRFEELFRRCYALREEETTGTTIGDQAWVNVLTTREQLAFMAYLVVKKGICELDDLGLKYFEDQEVAVAIELLLSEYEPAISLSPIANRVRHVQLAIICKGFWDVLGFSILERENRLTDLDQW